MAVGRRCGLFLFAGALLAVALSPSGSAAGVEAPVSSDVVCYENGPCIKETSDGHYLCTSDANCYPLLTNSPGCRLWEPYGTQPGISINPLLGLIVIDPDGCIWPRCDAYDILYFPHELYQRCTTGTQKELVEFVVTGTYDVERFVRERLEG